MIDELSVAIPLAIVCVVASAFCSGLGSSSMSRAVSSSAAAAKGEAARIERR